LDLCAICYGVEEPDEVCFVPCEAGVCGRGADLRYAEWAAGEGGEEEACGELAVAGELYEGLVGVGGHCGGFGEHGRGWWCQAQVVLRLEPVGELLGTFLLSISYLASAYPLLWIGLGTCSVTRLIDTRSLMFEFGSCELDFRVADSKQPVA
jgi:hypothetical protein